VKTEAFTGRTEALADCAKHLNVKAEAFADKTEVATWSQQIKSSSLFPVLGFERSHLQLIESAIALSLFKRSPTVSN